MAAQVIISRSEQMFILQEAPVWLLYSWDFSETSRTEPADEKGWWEIHRRRTNGKRKRKMVGTRGFEPPTL